MSLFRNFSSVFKSTAVVFVAAFLYVFIIGGGVSYDYNWDNDYQGSGDFLLALKAASLIAMGVFVLAALFKIVHNHKLKREREAYIIKYGEAPEAHDEERHRANEEYRQKRAVELLQRQMRAAGMDYQENADYAANQKLMADQLAAQARRDAEERVREAERRAAIGRQLLTLKNGDLVIHELYGKMLVNKVCRDSAITRKGQEIVSAQSSLLVRFGGHYHELTINDNLICNITEIISGQAKPEER